MNVFLINLVLALMWAAMTARFTPGNVILGFLLGYGILWFARSVPGTARYIRKVPKSVSFALFFVWKLFLANLRVAHDIITPTYYMRPGVLAIPLEARSDIEITALANLITLTPGTLSLDVSGDRRVLYLHAMFLDDPDALRREIKEGFERRLLEILR